MNVLNAKYHSWSIFHGFLFSFWTRPSGSLSYISPRFKELQTWSHLPDNRNSLFFVTNHRRCQLEAYIHAMCKYLLHRYPRQHRLASPTCPDKSGFNIKLLNGLFVAWYLQAKFDTLGENPISFSHIPPQIEHWPGIEPGSPRLQVGD